MASTTAHPLDPDELYDALSNDRRRACVSALDADGDWTRVKALANTIAAETTADPEDAVESTYISLIQIHLPKLESYDVVAYDEDEKVVAPGPAYDQTMSCLDAHASDGAPAGDAHSVQPFLFGGSVLGLLLALALAGLTPLLIGLVVVLQLLGLVLTMDAPLQRVVLERTEQWTG